MFFKNDFQGVVKSFKKYRGILKLNPLINIYNTQPIHNSEYDQNQESCPSGIYTKSMTLSRTTITKNTIVSFNFFDEVMAMTKKDELQQIDYISNSSSISSSNSSSNSNSMNLFQELEPQNKQENKRKRSRYF